MGFDPSKAHGRSMAARAAATKSSEWSVTSSEGCRPEKVARASLRPRTEDYPLVTEGPDRQTQPRHPATPVPSAQQRRHLRVVVLPFEQRAVQELARPVGALARGDVERRPGQRGDRQFAVDVALLRPQLRSVRPDPVELHPALGRGDDVYRRPGGQESAGCRRGPVREHCAFAAGERRGHQPSVPREDGVPVGVDGGPDRVERAASDQR